MASPYLEVFEILRYNICPHFIPFYDIPTMFCMPAGGARSSSFVEPFVHLLCSQSESRDFLQKRLCGLHGLKWF